MNNEWLFLAPLLVAYTIAVIPHLPEILLALSSEMPTPSLVVDMFAESDVILVGWLHFLAFDLMMGRWIWQRLVTTDKPIYISMPILFLCMNTQRIKIKHHGTSTHNFLGCQFPNISFSSLPRELKAQRFHLRLEQTHRELGFAVFAVSDFFDNIHTM